jgi:hypothetical protein
LASSSSKKNLIENRVLLPAIKKDWKNKIKNSIWSSSQDFFFLT